MKTMKQRCSTCPFRKKAKGVEIENRCSVDSMAKAGTRIPECHEHPGEFLCKGYQQFMEGSVMATNLS